MDKYNIGLKKQQTTNQKKKKLQKTIQTIIEQSRNLLFDNLTIPESTSDNKRFSSRRPI